MQSSFPIVIAAAGIGSRLGLNQPKCLVEVGGRILLERLLNDCLADEPDVRLVVGFREEEVIRRARAIRSDIIFVRNPAFRDTSVRHSFWLAARHIDTPFMVIDGDVLIDPDSFREFRALCDSQPTLVGVTPAGTQDAVFVHMEPDTNVVKAFSRKDRSAWEWCGVARLPPQVFHSQREYVFQCIEEALPAPAFVLQAAEVDTQADLEKALTFARGISSDRAHGATASTGRDR